MKERLIKKSKKQLIRMIERYKYLLLIQHSWSSPKEYKFIKSINKNIIIKT